MAVAKERLEEWLRTLEPGTHVGISEGGLSLEAVAVGRPYYEIGMVPYDDDDAWAEIYNDRIVFYHPQVYFPMAIVAEHHEQAGPCMDSWVEILLPEGNRRRWDLHIFSAEDDELPQVYAYPVIDDKTQTQEPAHAASATWINDDYPGTDAEAMVKHFIHLPEKKDGPERT